MKKKHALLAGVLFVLLLSTWIRVELRLRKTTEGLREFLGFVTGSEKVAMMSDILFPLTLIGFVWGLLLCYQIITIGPNEKVSTTKELGFRGIAACIAVFALWDAGYGLTAAVFPFLSIGPLRLGVDTFFLVLAYRFWQEAKRTRSVRLERLAREIPLS